MNLQVMCRLCFLKLHNPHDIFSTPGLLKKILKVTDVQIQQNDGLPKNICDVCCTKVQIANKFRNDVKNADIRIKSILQQSTSNITHQRRLSRMIQTTTYKWCHESALDTLQPDCQSKPVDNCRQMRSKSCTFQKSSDLSEGDSELRPTMKFSARKNCKEKWRRDEEDGPERSLIYSNANGWSLAKSYRTLIESCKDQNTQEDFLLPSAYAENGENFAENAISIDSKFSGEEETLWKVSNDSPKSLTRIDPDDDGYVPDNTSDWIGNRDKFSGIQKDPLNLLKVMHIRPLSYREVDDIPVGNCEQLSFRKRPATPMSVWDRMKIDESCRTSEVQEICDESSSFSTVWNSFRVSPYRNEGGLTDYGLRRNATVVSVPLPVLTRRGSSMKQSEKSVRENNKTKNNCPVCGKICASIRGIQVHMRSHRASRCPLCDASTVTKIHFRDHMKIHIYGPALPLSQCKLCKSVFKNNAGLMTHMRAHSRSVHAPYQCPHCTKTYATEWGLKKHLMNFHQ